jgi:imidazolonepropionase-like amidohydrolase
LHNVTPCYTFHVPHHRLCSLISTLVLLATLSLANSCSKISPPVLAITHVTLIDATGAPPQPDTTVIIRGTTILAVGPSASTPIPKRANVANAAGKFLIPSLVDMHIHLTGSGEPDGSREFILPLLIAHGITTVRDMGGYLDDLQKLRQEIDSGERLGPRIYFTGPYLDGNPPSFQPSIVVQNAAEAQAAVHQLKADGVDFIKVQSRLQPAAYFAIAAAAQKEGIRFIGHVPDSISPFAASDAGQASIEHLTGILLACSAREDELRQQQIPAPPVGETPAQEVVRQRRWQQEVLDSYSRQKADSLFTKFATNHTWQVPTFPLLMDLAYLTTETLRPNDPRMKYIPGNVKTIWQQGSKDSLENRAAADFAQRVELVRRSQAAVRDMNAAGVRILAGTDSAAPNVFPGFALHESIADLVEAGLTPMQALQAATSGPAEFLGLSAKQGSIAPGKRADLLLLDANPLDDIHNTQKIRAVILNGKLLDRAVLDAMLKHAEQFAATH